MAIDDPLFATPSDYAHEYRGLGLQVVPAKTPSEDKSWKRPAISWREHESQIVSDDTFSRWYGKTGQFSKRENVGFITGAASSGIFVVDLDIHKHPQAAIWWRGVLAAENNNCALDTATQTTGGGGKQLLFRAPAGWIPPTCKTSIGVDIRGQGGFAMLPPSMHESGTPYAWDAGCEPWECGIADAPQWLCDAVDSVAAQYGGRIQQQATLPSAPAIQTATPNHSETMFGTKIDGREDYMAKLVWARVVGMWRECPIKPPSDEFKSEMRDCWEVYQRNVKSRLTDANIPNHELLEREGRGITEFTKKWKVAQAQWDDKIAVHGLQAPPERIQPPAPERPIVTADTPGTEFDEETGEVINFPATELCAADFESIPPREWIYGNDLVRGFVSVLGSPGGVGKTAYTLGIGTAVASGRNIMSHDQDRPSPWQKIHVTGAVWFINLEDPRDELRRRMFALFRHHNLRFDGLKNKIYIDSGRDRPVVIAKRDPSGTLIAHPIVDDLVAEIKRRNIVLLVVDPFVQSHDAEENRNDEMNIVMALWGLVAHRGRCAVWLVHHFRKGGAAGDGEAFRGAGAIQGAARIMSTLAAMSPEEAEKLGIDDEKRKSYVRLDSAKANMAPSAEHASWFNIVGVNIGNASTTYPLGDSVQVTIPWSPPTAWEGIPMSAIVDILNKIDAGMPDGEFYAISKQSKSRWIIPLVMEGTGKTDGQARTIVSKWFAEGVLIESEYVSKSQKRVTSRVLCCPQKKAEMSQNARPDLRTSHE